MLLDTGHLSFGTIGAVALDFTMDGLMVLTTRFLGGAGAAGALPSGGSCPCAVASSGVNGAGFSSGSGAGGSTSGGGSEGGAAETSAGAVVGGPDSSPVTICAMPPRNAISADF